MPLSVFCQIETVASSAFVGWPSFMSHHVSDSRLSCRAQCFWRAPKFASNIIFSSFKGWHPHILPYLLASLQGVSPTRRRRKREPRPLHPGEKYHGSLELFALQRCRIKYRGIARGRKSPGIVGTFGKLVDKLVRIWLALPELWNSGSDA